MKQLSWCGSAALRFDSANQKVRRPLSNHFYSCSSVISSVCLALKALVLVSDWFVSETHVLTVGVGDERSRAEVQRRIVPQTVLTCSNQAGDALNNDESQWESQRTLRMVSKFVTACRLLTPFDSCQEFLLL